MAQQDEPVQIERLSLIESPLGPVRLVAFNFEFPGRELIDVKGLGFVPASGSFQYFTLEEKLEFCDTETGSSVLSVPLENPVQMMGHYSVTLPAPTDFSPAFRSGRWDENGSFQVHLTEVLNRQFPSGYLVLQFNGSNHVLTTYRTLDDVREPLFGRIAVMVEPPADASLDATFRVRFLSQERRSHTDWQELSSVEVQKAAEQYMNSLVREMARPAP